MMVKYTRKVTMDKINNKFDEIDKMFEDLQQANNETVDSLKDRLSSKEEDLVSLKESEYSERKSVSLKRPSLPKTIPASLNTRLDIFLYCIKNIEYGPNNRSYVDGHLEALNKYLERARLDHQNLEVVLGTLLDEIRHSRSINKTDLKEKGYYDGLNYVNSALKKSKDVMAKKINDTLKRELFHE